MLIIDEVLAVGDVEFQKRCLGKMESVAQGGRTVLFVSHNMAAVESLCHRVAVLTDGRIASIGQTSDVVSVYLRSFQGKSQHLDLSDPKLPREGDGRARIVDATLRTADGTATSTIRMGEGIVFSLRIKAYDTIRQANVVVGIFNSRGHRTTYLGSYEMHPSPFSCEGGDEFLVRCELPTLNLPADSYTINVGIADVAAHLIVERVVNVRSLQIVAADVYGTTRVPTNVDAFFDGSWTFERLEDALVPSETA